MTTQVYSSHQQTRQQLDELDRLLQRMLSLPTNSTDIVRDYPEPLNPEEFVPLPPSLPQAHVASRSNDTILHAWRLSGPVTPVEPPLAVAVEAADAIPYSAMPAPYPYSLVFGQPLPAEAAPLPPVAEVVVPSTPPPVAHPVAQPAWAVPLANDEDEPSYSLLSLPFVAINRLFDGLTYLLGPLGGWLRQPGGRQIIGWVGILMILGAIGWGLADWYGNAANR